MPGTTVLTTYCAIYTYSTVSTRLLNTDLYLSVTPVFNTGRTVPIDVHIVLYSTVGEWYGVWYRSTYRWGGTLDWIGLNS